jgi:hypothetical protein
MLHQIFIELQQSFNCKKNVNLDYQCNLKINYYNQATIELQIVTIKLLTKPLNSIVDASCNQML